MKLTREPPPGPSPLAPLCWVLGFSGTTQSEGVDISLVAVPPVHPGLAKTGSWQWRGPMTVPRRCPM